MQDENITMIENEDLINLLELNEQQHYLITQIGLLRSDYLRKEVDLVYKQTDVNDKIEAITNKYGKGRFDLQSGIFIPVKKEIQLPKLKGLSESDSGDNSEEKE